MTIWNRRRFLSAGLATAALPARASTGADRRYRADATLLPLGVPLYSRRGVGGAQVSVQERSEGSLTRVTIRFAAGSAPERAAGLDRFGFLEEDVECEGGTPVHAEYVGLMTDSPETNVNEAKRALHSAPARPAVAAIQGSSAGGRHQSRVLRAGLSEPVRWQDAASLAGVVRTLFSGGASGGVTVHEGRGGRPSTFLYELRQAVSDPVREREGAFHYNGARYALHTRKYPDRTAADRFAERGLAAAGAPVERVQGAIVNLERGSRTEFKLWIEAGREALPIRFEYRARSFMRLSFEAEPARATP